MIGSEEVSSNTSQEVGDEKESEEIWGRGLHGGMRRRVRERWEKDKEQESVAER